MTYDELNDLMYELYNDNSNGEGDYEVVIKPPNSLAESIKAVTKDDEAAQMIIHTH